MIGGSDDLFDKIDRGVRRGLLRCFKYKVIYGFSAIGWEDEAIKVLNQEEILEAYNEGKKNYMEDYPDDTFIDDLEKIDMRAVRLAFIEGMREAINNHSHYMYELEGSTRCLFGTKLEFTLNKQEMKFMKEYPNDPAIAQFKCKNICLVKFTLEDLQQFQKFENFIIDLPHLEIKVCPDPEVYLALQSTAKNNDIRIALDEEEFTKLVTGKIVNRVQSGTIVQICLEDIGYDRIISILKQKYVELLEKNHG